MNNDPSKRTRKIALISIIVLLVLAGLAFLSFHSGVRKANTVNNTLSGGSTYDANSGNVIDNPKNKAVEPEGLQSNEPAYLGFSDFLNYVTQFQVAALKQAFYKYATSQTPLVKQVSITKNSIQSVPVDPQRKDTTIYYNFTVVMDSKTKLNAKLAAIDLDTIDLVLSNPQTNAVVYDSGQIVNDGS